jgi:DNA uptake protein ComE-like DNA-binding protein
MRIPLALVVLASLAASPAVAQTAALANTSNTAPTAPVKSKPTRKAALIDINFATKEQLEALPQIGPARAEAIIKGRPYRGKDEFRKGKVIPANAYDAIKRKIVARQQF